MNIYKALNRLKWRFSSKNAFTPNQLDREAYNEIARFCKKNLEGQWEHHLLFGKLYCFLFAELVHYYKTTYDDPIPQAELNRICDMDMELLFQKVTDRLNAAERSKWLETKDGDIPELTVLEVKENLKVMANCALNAFSERKIYGKGKD